MSKKILLTGATGSIGQRLLGKLTARGDEVIIFTRNPGKAKNNLPGSYKFVNWDYRKTEEWKEYLVGVDAVVHLAGANLGAKRWNDEYKKLAYDSRIISTRNLVEAIKASEKKPKSFICSSAIGFYGNRYDEILDENSNTGNDFLANLCNDWEKAAEKVEELGVRRVSIRTGLVLSKGEGLMQKLYLPFKLFIGGPMGNGLQWFPWIHIDDIVGIYLQAIYNEKVNGSINAASPGIVTNKEFSKTLGKFLSRPALLPVPKIALRIISGELGNYVTDSQRISVDKILNSGYHFKFDNLSEALNDILN